MSHLGWLITAADSVFPLSVICISWHSVRINLTMTNSHCNNEKHYCRRYDPRRISGQMDEKSVADYVSCVFSLCSLSLLPPSSRSPISPGAVARLNACCPRCNLTVINGIVVLAVQMCQLKT